MTLASDIIDWAALGQAVYVSVGVGLIVLLLGALAVYGSLKGQDVKAEGHSGEAVAFNALTVIGVIGLVASIVIGIVELAK